MTLKVVDCKIAGFLNKRTKLIRTEMIRHEPGDLIVDQVNNSLVFLSPDKSYIYKMGYVDNCSNPYEIPPQGQLGWQEYRLTIECECGREEQPDLFLEILQSSKKVIRGRGYNVYIDGKHEYYTLTRKKMTEAVNLIREARKDPEHLLHEKYRKVKIIKIVDPSGNATLLIHDPSMSHYNMC
jgi:hypothetical protein